LEDWYNSLDSQNLNWDFENLCYEGEIQCDGSEPQRIIKLYNFFSFLFLISYDL